MHIKVFHENETDNCHDWAQALHVGCYQNLKCMVVHSCFSSNLKSTNICIRMVKFFILLKEWIIF